MTKMLVVYSLRQELKKDMEDLQRVQALSLDRSRPNMGLSPRLGLYGSDDWWRNVDNAVIPRAAYCGTITETFYAGMDSDRRHNSFRMKTDDGREYSYGMVPQNSSYKNLYRPGHRAEIITIFNEYKSRNPDGTPTIYESPLEIKLSTKPVAGA
jgi:hypothetical protein